MYRTHVYSSLAAFALLVAVVNAASMCTGYPKMYNGKHCASTTRYWDGQMGACGCGTGNTSPFSWQWTKPTAAASAPIFGSGTWCGSGCGKCFKLTPTAAGMSPVGRGAPNTNSVVIKVTNLCPYAGNEQWCAYDINTYGFDAHFDIMDYNMNGLVTSMGWDNPEVTYEEVDCASNGYNDWSCQCASSTSTPTNNNSTKSSTKAPSSPTKAPSTPTKAPSSPTTSPTSSSPAVSGGSVKLQVASGVNEWWFGFSVANNIAFTKIEAMDTQGGLKSWTQMTYQGGNGWNLWSVAPTSGTLKAPISLRFTTTSGKVLTSSNIIPSITAAAIDTKFTV